ncbi:benzoylsuccinyl-CoA thiolase [Nocardioides sp. GY 10113]|uniref:Zn-ribbon domain-containing OB-fold protein n=1 Tax=Nocardioides sp. GY 10113 TaxID=2569761 RepID=UPI0010A7A353|nr:OB-fold domain-containing protein [Nocardioides sp. GY 10113]TIC86299.1 benzoylsuccinyl-CoA thiolase [Nocardioides sp. GY 10113]
MTATPAVAGWFTTDAEPRLLASRCTTCANLVFPPVPEGAASFCRNPACAGSENETVPLSRTGRVWSYTDAQYQPPAPFVPATDPFEPFALAAVELPEGLVVLGQVADGFGVADLRVGAEVELVVETLNVDESGERTIWRWRPVASTEEIR